MWNKHLDGLTFREQANLVKQGFSFVFCSTEDLQKMPLGKLSFLHVKLFLENKGQKQVTDRDYNM